MDKGIKPLVIFIIFIIIAISIYLSFFVEEVNQTDNSNVKDSFPSVSQLHWKHMPLTYKITGIEYCDENRVRKVKEAINILENTTSGKVSFKETTGDTDLIFRCIDLDIYLFL